MPMYLRTGLSLPSVANVDTLLAKCPSPRERRRIRRDFQINFEPGVPTTETGPWGCTAGGNETSLMLGVYNTFRVMKYINFSRRMPITNSRNMYDWLKSLNIYIKIDNRERSSGGGDFVLIRWQVFSAPWNRVFFDPQSGMGMMNTIGLLLHEARHTRPGGHIFHNCGTKDSSLSHRGAFAMQYWYYLWCERYSGDYLNPQQKMGARMAKEGSRRMFCNHDPRMQKSANYQLDTLLRGQA